jgi:hypothetical protein
MEVPGTCQVCHTVGAMRTCKLCGRLVCQAHFRHDVGSCTICKPQPISGEDAERTKLPPLPPDAGGRYT